ncbi:helix-turn-helix transcriptional regulator [Litoribacter alkaliphilus]|uniref:Helix-turn-helix transcriptional regulator n=1 Tax=Litoribacter ruber TaxID=702568 RepID=A0AAP2CJE2_9BACT|nr:helix-turn-helix transcriptional regulator [Litoribacter alkaliphilus]MBS9525841.1 helix-turn-helix transcriptional regulator [Litoribacter alkaliphilus]
MKDTQKTSAFERLRAKVKPHDREFASLSLDIVDQIHEILDSKNWNQKTLADKMGKRESEISRLLSGTHNLSILTLAKIQVAIGETIICTPKRFETISSSQVYFIPENTSMTYGERPAGESNYVMVA